MFDFTPEGPVRERKAKDKHGRGPIYSPRDRARPVTADNLGAWMLTCNPKVSDLATALEDGHTAITSWSVVLTYRAELMGEGQRVLFWVTGSDSTYPQRGLWGDGTVLGPMNVCEPGDDPGLWLDDAHRARSTHAVPVDIRLFDQPIARPSLLADPRLATMEIFRQPQMGNPLVVTKDEIAVLNEYIATQPTTLTITRTGAGFGTAAVRADVEDAAMALVTNHYEANGWQVEDVSSQCLGWDLTARTAQGATELVEVKGASGLNPVVLLTRNERRAARERSGWRLAVVTRALSGQPRLMVVDGPTALKAAQPFVYQVDLTGLGSTPTARVH